MSSVLSLLVVGGLMFVGYQILKGSSSGPNILNTAAALPPPPPLPQQGGGCAPDPSVDKYIANDGPGRFKVLSPCATVSGVVTLVHYPTDGDTVFALKPDPEYAHMVAPANNNPKMKGGIWCEMICQRKNVSVEPIHQGDCYNFQGPKFKEPKVGDRITVQGRYQLDLREGGHSEIHPVYRVLS